MNSGEDHCVGSTPAAIRWIRVFMQLQASAAGAASPPSLFCFARCSKTGKYAADWAHQETDYFADQLVLRLDVLQGSKLVVAGEDICRR